MNILVTGGTVFASRFTAEYFAAKGHTVYVLNRGSRKQSPGIIHISADRHSLGDTLKPYQFDAVLDVTAYNRQDVQRLTEALGSFGQYVFISSSAVYPETLPQPFREDQPCGENKIWGAYGTDKLAAEAYLTETVPDAYIIRPPYLYGPMNNLYREAFVFECAEHGRPFYIPKDGRMPLQFFHIRDLCRLTEMLLIEQPAEHIYNAGNPETVDICEWVRLCYAVLGKEPEFRFTDGSVPQRSYFPFYDYAYQLDVTRQRTLLPETEALSDGLRESYEWFRTHRDEIRRKPLLDYIDRHFAAPF